MIHYVDSKHVCVCVCVLVKHVEILCIGCTLIFFEVEMYKVYHVSNLWKVIWLLYYLKFRIELIANVPNHLTTIRMECPYSWKLSTFNPWMVFIS